nr:hypothetical protein BaRGS_033505 [Batillaria attramentaria]
MHPKFEHYLLKPLLDSTVSLDASSDENDDMEEAVALILSFVAVRIALPLYAGSANKAGGDDFTVLLYASMWHPVVMTTVTVDTSPYTGLAPSGKNTVHSGCSYDSTEKSPVLATNNLFFLLHACSNQALSIFTWSQVFRLVTVLPLFWIDFVPVLGMHTEGAIYTAVVETLVMPLTTIFWMLFRVFSEREKEKESGIADHRAGCGSVQRLQREREGEREWGEFETKMERSRSNNFEKAYNPLC